MNYLYIRFKQLMNEEEGQTATEYALVIGVFVLALVAASPTMVQGMGTFFNNLRGTLASWGATT